MLARTLFLFLLLFSGAFLLVYAAGFTKFFDKTKLTRILKITSAGILALILALFVFMIIVNIDHFS